MSISKKRLLSLIKQNLNEMPMDFDSPDRPHPDVTRALSTGNTPLKKIPFPKTGNPNQNFQEVLASERYKEVVNNVRRYTGLNVPLSGNPNQRLLLMMMDAHNRIIQIEQNHREELENLAVKLVCDEMGIDPNEINFDVKLVSTEQIDVNDFERDQPNEDNPEEVNPEDGEDDGEQEQQPNQPQDENQNAEQQIFFSLEKINLERAKQRLLNAIMQGASKRGHFMYHQVEQELRQITGSDQLINLYGVMMSINDTNYWQFGDNTISDLQSSVAGKVDVIMPSEGGDDEDQDGGDDDGGDDMGGENNNDPSKPTIIVRGVNFPVLVHEVIKGAMKILIAHGQPDYEKNPEERELYRQVKQQENTLEKEVWDLRLGPAIWARLREAIPEDVLVDNDKTLQNYLYMNIFQLETKRFLVFMKEVLSGSDDGKRLVANMVESIRQMFRNEDYEQTMRQFNDELDDAVNDTDDDELRDFLGDLGIGLSDDEE